MNRRQAIGNIILGSAAVMILPQCQSETITVPTFSNLEVAPNTYQALGQLSQTILPYGNVPISTPETTENYILNIVDQCFSPADRERFLMGLDAYQTYLKEEVKTPFNRWDDSQKTAILSHLEELSEKDSSLNYFYQESKNLTREHFLRSEHYMTNYLEYKFIPGGYEPCVSV